MSPTATKALSNRGVPGPRLPPSQRQRKTRAVCRLSHPRLCVDRKVCLIGAPIKWGPGPTSPARGRCREATDGVGWATMGTKCPSEPSPAAFCLLCRHGQSRSPSRAKPYITARRVVAPYTGWKPARSSVWPSGQPPSPLGGRLKQDGTAKHPNKQKTRRAAQCAAPTEKERRNTPKNFL